MIVDVSKHQGLIDWNKLAPVLDFVIIKASGLFANGADPYYARNVAGAVSHGVPFHVFHFLYCLTETQAKQDARLFYETVRAVGYWPLFWVLDCEAKWGIKDRDAPKIAAVFEEELRNLAGRDIRVALYVAQEKYYDWKFNYNRYEYVWIPGYGEKWKPKMPCDMWQYTSDGSAPGINGRVDCNVLMGTKPMSFFTGKNTGGEIVATDYRKYILSTGTHYISNSGSDENGNLKGGKAGDQNGKEWRLRSWYNRPWTCVLRWPDINVGTLLGQLCIDAALNDKIGYDQGQRDSYWKQVKKVGYLPAKVVTPCEEDCTAGVNANVHCAAYLLDIDPMKAIPETGVRSGNMRKYYKAAGFKVLTDSKYLTGPDYLLPGDILLYDNHHGATNVTKGRKVDYTYHDVIGNLDEYRGDATGDLRNGDVGPEVKAMQEGLIALGYDLGVWGADGEFGDCTEQAVEAFQRANGLPDTGVYDAATRAALEKALDEADEPVEKPRTVRIVGGNCYVRAAPNTGGKKLGVAHKGDIYAYQGQTSDDGWNLIDFKNQNGWVSGKYSRLEE